MAQNPNTQALSDAGVSIWLDDLSRHRLTSGGLKDLIASKNVVGVTTNPSIFQSAISGSKDYDDAIAGLYADGRDVDGIIEALTTDDVRDACDVFMDLYRSTQGYDGRVSIEVDPRHANDTDATIEQAQRLYDLVDRENVMIKIPATLEGLPAITEVISRGISVNVTLIFSVARYEEVIEAYLEGLEKAAEAGRDLATIHSVASFFISRVDTEIDKRLEEIGGDALELLGKAAVANGRAAFGLYAREFSSERFGALKEKGANVQRALWASTGVKNEDYSDTLYVDELVTDPAVNTMPEKTLDAFADHGDASGRLTVASAADEEEKAEELFDRLAEAGIDLADVFAQLESEGVSKFVDAWGELLDTVGSARPSENA
ncbi:transaldolase [Helcobacillus massiliensis]|uniref:transaldolase n=1 Tax=Helcobacillus TaxID=1161125 RepID=UPI001EF489C2|nr:MULTISPECIES: transaldolase [Helcobacillus]MCG7426979.1 transaldolase [Helcobacillus sp. ACRRO]MCT1557015.1 transaldolase [Helcobacillus massiliensis]MCT2035404.1 transaldolase [Helcobacillus massiliensis]MCT2331381.1 transaldolase [Helcobacillus massiliensis]